MFLYGSLSVAALVVIVTISASASVSAKTCWGATWYNNSHPNAGNGRSDIEPLPPANDLKKICPQGQTTLAVRYKDNKGEPSTHNKNATCNHGYYLVNIDKAYGLNCTPYSKDCTCPDFAVQFGCDCSVTTRPTPGACQSRPCMNGGVCFSIPPNDYFCNCMGPYTGRSCELVKGASGQTTSGPANGNTQSATNAVTAGPKVTSSPTSSPAPANGNPKSTTPAPGTNSKQDGGNTGTMTSAGVLMPVVFVVVAHLLGI